MLLTISQESHFLWDYVSSVKGQFWSVWHPHSTKKNGAIKPATIVTIPSMMKIHLQPWLYIPSPTLMSDRAYANYDVSAFLRPSAIA